MFEIKEGMEFIKIDQEYLKELHKVCTEVYFKENNYENKPYVGVLLNEKNKKYVIPLSSAKEKHKTWKNVDRECFLIYEKAKKEKMQKSDIWVEVEGGDMVKHILSVMDIKKMIPIKDEVYQRIDLNPEDSDTLEMKKYKDLLNKEYSFCIKIISDVVDKANKLYEKQMKNGKVAKFCCDFKALEDVCDTY